jgi:hypothetical protein
MAHAILAILLASAIAATLVGLRANRAASQGRCLVPWILASAECPQCQGQACGHPYESSGMTLASWVGYAATELAPVEPY